MAALLRGLRAGRVLRALGSGIVTPQCSRVQRGFRQGARIRLQDDSKSDQLTTAASSSSSLADQQHFQVRPSEQETACAPEQTVPESVSVSSPAPEMEVSASTSELEVSAPELEVSASTSELEASASAPELEASASTPELEASVSAPEQDVPESSPVSTPVQEVSVSALEPPVHTPEVEAAASAQQASASAQEASAAEEEVAASALAESASEEEVSASKEEVCASEEDVTASAPELETSASEQEAPEPDHSSAEEDGEESGGYETEEELRARVLTAALEFVPQHGWSVEAISAAAQSLGLSSAAAGMFTNGAGDLVLHFISQSNAQLAQMMAEQHNQVQQGQAEPKETAEFLRYAVEARLRMLIPHIDNWPQAMSILLLPHNIPNSLKNLSTLIDDIWYYAGDRSTDLNWYTCRAALTGVYNTTQVVMLQDSSHDFQDTWVFLDKRIQDIVNMANTAKQVQSTGEAVAQGIMGAVVTLSNLAGINQRR
ncbi:hypothetical protein SKAU_G00312270 [Synaphobranchus kaupii]|uniref:Ubiquinone biosynthesis protein n=1 Tax=Synaphobranchus kaupii TaxID=118154 RepID=A0A9Q1ERV6_SYNKA|nr:hypothetical protein SKAU_G00312270 [Synaphobranchus kaupii]